MDADNKPPSILSSLVSGILLVIGGIILLSLLVNNTWLVSPDHPDFLALQRAVVENNAAAGDLIKAADWRLLALFLLGIIATVAGVFLPVVYLVNRRLLDRDPAEATLPPLHILLRQAFWTGSWVAVCVWLHMHRTLGLPIAVLVAILFALIEGLLLIRRRTRLAA